MPGGGGVLHRPTMVAGIAVAQTPMLFPIIPEVMAFTIGPPIAVAVAGPAVATLAALRFPAVARQSHAGEVR